MPRSACHLLLGVTLVWSIGCRTPDPSVDLLESELRWMEDNLYHLDHQLDLCQEQLRSAQRSNAALRNELAKALDQDRDHDQKPSDRSTGRGKSAAEESDYDQETKEELLDLKIPRVELDSPTADVEESANETAEKGADEDTGAEDTKAGKQGPEVDTSALPQIELNGIPQDPRTAPQPLPTPKAKPSPPPENSDPFQDGELREQPGARDGDGEIEEGEVSRIRLNSRLTGTYDDDGTEGPDGILVVIEPQDSQGHYRAVPGEITVRLDASPTSPTEAPMAIWTFDTVETSGMLRKSLFGQGVHLRLPWPSPTVPTGRLRLRVVFESTKGERFLAEKMISIGGTSTEIGPEDGPIPPLNLRELTRRLRQPQKASSYEATPQTLVRESEVKQANWSPTRQKIVELPQARPPQWKPFRETSAR